MNKIMNFVEKSEVWIFYVFLLTFTLSIRKVLFFYPIRGKFNEYSGIYFYLSDLFVWGILGVAGISILCNKILLKSRYRIDILPYLKQKVFFVPLLLVMFSFFSVFWSENHSIAIFRSIKLLEFYLLYLWVIFRIFHLSCWQTGLKYKENEKCSTPEEMFHVEYSTGQTWNIFNNSIFIIVLIGIIQSIIAIWQFIIQKSIGLIWIKESIISVNISGVAKIVLGGEKYIRAYGLFPHPNILGGFLILSILVTILYFKMFHQKDNVPRGTSIIPETNNKVCSTCLAGRQAWNIRAGLNIWILLGIQLSALILTFSKSAWLGLAVALFFVWSRNVPRGTLWVAKIKKMFHVKHIKFIALIGVIVFLILLIISPNTHSFIGKSVEDRIFYLNVSRGTFMEHPIVGTGSGQFVLNFKNIGNLEDWQFQPVHNVFLLILNELGILGLFLFILFIWGVIKNVPPQDKCSTCLVGRQTWNILRGRCGIICSYNYFKSMLIGFLVIMLFDHYFWDIQQGQAMFWLVLGVVAGINMCISEKSTWLSTEKE